MVRSVLLVFVSLLFLNTQAQVTKKVLFVGNSYTYANDLPKMVADLAKSKGDSLYKNSSAAGGQRLSGHAASQGTYTSFRQNNWDYIVLQEQSQLPSFPPTQVQKDVFPYAKQLCDSIRALPSCTKPIFFMTWGRKNGDQSNCKFYKPLCTYEGMQLELRKNYLTMAKTNNAFASPVGMVWREVRRKWPAFNLYDPDESHPTKQGTYVAACTFYAVIYGKSPVGASFKGGLVAAEADSIQKAAAAIVFDSLPTWNIKYEKLIPSLTYSITNDTVSFNYTGQAVDNIHWDFGDGASNTISNPTHVFGVSDTFTVKLTIDTKCLSADTTFKIIVKTIQASVKAVYIATAQYDTVTFNYGGTPADSVKWNFGNGKSDTGYVATHIYGVADTFTTSVKAFYKGATDSVSKQVITTLRTVGTPVFSASEFGLSIYPNPIENNVAIESEEKIIGIEILDVNGRLLKKFEKINSKGYNFNADFLNSGTYIIQIRTEKSTVTQRIIKR